MQGTESADALNPTGSFDWSIVVFAILGALLGAALIAVVCLACALHKALRRIARLGLVDEMRSARADSMRDGNYGTIAVGGGDYAKHASEFRADLDGSGAGRHYDVLTTAEANPSQ